MTLKPPLVAAIVLGFASAGAALAARAADRPQVPTEPEPTRRRWPFWLATSVVGLVALGFLAANVDRFVSVFLNGAGSRSGLLARLPERLNLLSDWFGWLVALLFRDIWVTTQGPVYLVMAVTHVWIAYRLALMLLTSPGSARSPLDDAFRNRSGFGVFLIRWFAVTVLMVAALPSLFVTGLVVLHGLFQMTK